MSDNSQSSGTCVTSGEAMEIYDVVARYAMAVGQQPVGIGSPGRCRYCGAESSLKFQQVAHTLPEAPRRAMLVSCRQVHRVVFPG